MSKTEKDQTTEQVDPAMSFDQFLLSPTGSLEVMLPSGEPMLWQGNQVKVEVYSPASAEYARAQAALQRKARERVFAKKKSQNHDADLEAENEADVKFLCDVTQFIVNFPYPGGKEAVYRERRLAYIADQVRQYLSDQGNFYKA